MARLNNKMIIAEATEEAGNITNSVLVLARVANVTPAKLAEALVDSQKNGDFLVKFTNELVSARLTEAYTEAEQDG